MLVSKKYDSGDIVSFKLVSGDEVVARIIEETDDGYYVERPCTAMPSPQGIGLIQSLFTTDSDVKVTIKKTHVLMCAESLDAMKKHYIKTTTGIEPVTRGSIIT